MNSRGQWRTQSGFILAALGAAIGLGNIWRFSYVIGDSGGAAFLLVYFLAIILVGLPLLLVELSIGRTTQCEAASAFHYTGRSVVWQQAGILGVIVSFVILTYYSVIAGWALKFFVAFATGIYPLKAGGASIYFFEFLSGPVEPVLWQACVMAATAVVVIRGIEKGIERANKSLMPILAVIVVALAVHSLTLPRLSRGSWPSIFLFGARDGGSCHIRKLFTKQFSPPSSWIDHRGRRHVIRHSRGGDHLSRRV